MLGGISVPCVSTRVLKPACFNHEFETAMCTVVLSMYICFHMYIGVGSVIDCVCAHITHSQNRFLCVTLLHTYCQL